MTIDLFEVDCIETKPGLIESIYFLKMNNGNKKTITKKEAYSLIEKGFEMKVIKY